MSKKIVSNTHKMLTEAEELAKFGAWEAAETAGDTRTSNRLFGEIVIQYSPIVGKMVRKMRGYNLDASDMECEGLEALVKAARKFDSSMGYRFATYAGSCIKSAMYSHIVKNYFMTNICTANNKYRKVFFGYRKWATKFYREAQSNGTAGDRHTIDLKISKALGVDIKIIEEMKEILYDPHISFDTPVGDTETEEEAYSPQEYLASPETPVDDVMIREETKRLQKDIIQTVLQTFDHRTQFILRYNILIERENKITLEDLGAKFGISRERVRQIREKNKNEFRGRIIKELRLRDLRPSDIMPS